MTQFKAKPIIVDAVQCRIKDMDHPQWLSEAMNFGAIYWQGGDCPYFTVHTVTGTARVIPGDWIVRNDRMEFSVCRSEDFAATFERIN